MVGSDGGGAQGGGDMIGAFLKGRSQILAALLAVAIVMCMTAMKRPFVNDTLLNLEMVSLSLCFRLSGSVPCCWQIGVISCVR